MFLHLSINHSVHGGREVCPTPLHRQTWELGGWAGPLGADRPPAYP